MDEEKEVQVMKITRMEGMMKITNIEGKNVGIKDKILYLMIILIGGIMVTGDDNLLQWISSCSLLCHSSSLSLTSFVPSN